jgi:hypothetical protein
LNHRCYDVHGLVHVLIEAGVRPEIVREIEFQIGSFRVADGSIGSSSVPRIILRPYAGRLSTNDADFPEAVFYVCSGIVGASLQDSGSKIAVEKQGNGYAVGADYANVLINLYLQLLIAPQGFSMVHAAAYRNLEGKVTVLAGAGGIGKTAVLGYAVRERGLQHLGDDLVIVSTEGRCLSFPRAFVLKSYHREGYADTFSRLRLPKWNLYSAKRFLVENAPFVGLAKSFLRRSGLYYKVADLLRPQPFLATVRPEDLFGENSVADSGEIGRIAYMDRMQTSRFELRPLDSEVLVNRLFSVIHYEWKDFLTHLISLGSLDVVNLPRYYEQVVIALRGAVEGRELVHVCIPAGATPEQLVRFLDDQGFF